MLSAIMTDNNKYQYSNWLIDWKANYSSKSKWRTTIDIYEIILKGEFSDTDYWYSVGGDNVNSKLSKFSTEDWDKLKEDLINWQSNQIEILGIILTSSEDYFEINDIKTFQSYKSQCYTYILNICDDNLFSDLIDDLNFIKLNNYKNIQQLKLIKERLLMLENSPIIENDNSTEYFYTRKRFNDFVKLLGEEIENLNNNCR